MFNSAAGQRHPSPEGGRALPHSLVAADLAEVDRLYDDAPSSPSAPGSGPSSST